MSKLFIWILHILYWLLFLSLLLLFYGFIAMVPGWEKVSNTHGERFIFWSKLMIGFAVMPAAISFYSCYTFLFSKLLSRKKFFLFCLAGFFVSFCASVIGALTESTPYLFGKNFLFGDSFRSAISILIIMTIGAFISGIIGAVLKGFITWYNEIRIKEELMQRNHEMELDLIRAQLNPHFLFNTLNNIDVLIEQDQIKASDYLKKLSDILRFTLYEAKTERIPVMKELSYIEKYLALQQLRNSNPAFVKFQIKGDPSIHSTEPMLFIPFIENAFKYAENKNQVHGIKIDFIFTAEEIVFSCSNNYHIECNAATPEQGGLGNQLIERRLNLLYPGQHQLIISNVNNQYSVKLTLTNTHEMHHS